MPRTTLDAVRQGSATVGTKECANCGAVSDLLRCSRCHSVWFCGVACQKAYWPFHKTECKRNEFADLAEETEPKFASWMRKHGKMAVLKDDEVDRLERASQAVSGPSRQEIMGSMYGRLEPKPAAPSYSDEEVRALAIREEADLVAVRRAEAMGSRHYDDSEVPSGLGLETAQYKWHQTQSHIEVLVPLPEGVAREDVQVRIAPCELEVTVHGRKVLNGRLWREIKAELSTWYMAEGVLEVSLLKRHRRGAYEGGETNATTFWPSILAAAPEGERLHGPAPTAYYRTPWEGQEEETSRLRSRRATRKAIAASATAKSIAAA